jgi:hypothetical protein
VASSFVMMPGYFNVKAYGATGDGTTDDTSAIQAAIDAVDDADGGTIYFPPGVYFVNGALGGSNSENAQLRLPTRTVGTDVDATIRFLGAESCGNLMGFGDVPAPTGGSIIKTTKTGAGNLFGIGQGTNNISPFSAVNAIFENLSIVTYSNPDIAAFDMRNAANAGFRNVSIFSDKPSHGTVVQPTHSGSYGVRFPSTNNAADVWADRLTVYNFYNGIEIAECFNGTGMVCLYACYKAVRTTPMNHAANFGQLTIARCPYGIVAPGSGEARVRVHTLVYEYQDSSVGGAWMNEVYTLDDASNRVYGSLTAFPVKQGVGPDTHTVKNGGSNFTITAVG